ncbi:MAG TPA: indole-3-glycerol phosphate synthase TrpC [Candidatus Krumholzibacteria bacterium]|nr:indole-3-glycerol phosphate synthase TrpC [Candidatus Krumholzibacteria bacterium]
MNFLERVVAEKRAALEERKHALPPEALELCLPSNGIRDFHAAVSRPGAVIAELKARTPTIPSFRHSGGLRVLASIYEHNGAAAVSIVTDPARFGTSLEDVAPVRAVTTLPVIAKDFIVDRYQVLEARTAGADAILLIVRILDLPELKSLHAYARELGMHVLVETHDESEILAALAAGAKIVGINNRDLDTMTISLETTRRLAHLVPDDVVLVSESGIQTRDDIDGLLALRPCSFLVGGSLLDAADPGALLRGLTGQGDGEREIAR